MLGYLDGQQTRQELDEVIAIIARRTRNYAKRQCTFWNMLSSKINDQLRMHKDEYPHAHVESVDLTYLTIDLYIKHLSKKVLIRDS